MDQQLFQWIIGGICVIGGIMLKTCWDAVKDLQAADSELTDKVAAIEVLVAGQYIKRDEVERSFTAVFTKLDRIESKIDNKADK